MKTKIAALFIFAAVILLSFTVANSSDSKPQKPETEKSRVDTSGGLAIEDSNQWN